MNYVKNYIPKNGTREEKKTRLIILLKQSCKIKDNQIKILKSCLTKLRLILK